jgi:TP901 family phage tail tape measure protein
MSNVVSFVYVLKDKFSRVGNQIGGSVDRLRNKFRRLGTDTKKTSKDINKSSFDIAGSFKRMFAAGVAYMGLKRFISIGADFQSSMADLQSITGATGKTLSYLSDESLRLAKVSRTAQSEVANAFTVVASAKSELLKDPKGLSKVTEQVLLLKNATGMELAGAAKVVTESLNQFNAGADQAARYVNVLAAGSKVGASMVNETGVAIVKSGVAASMAKLNFEELNSMIQVLAKNGMKAEVAGTGIKTMLLKLESQGVNAIKPSVVGLNTALDNLAKANLNTAQMSALFGTEAVSIGAKLIQNRGLVAQWTKEITGTKVANEQATARMATFKSKIAGLQVAIQDKLIKVFLRLEPVISKTTERFTAWLDSIDAEQITTFADGLAKVASVAAEIGSWFKYIFEYLDKIGKSIGNLAGAISTGNFKDMFSGLASVAGPLPGVSFKDMYDYITGGGETVKNATGTAAAQKSQTDVNINMRAPTGVIQSVKSKTTGKVSGLNVGVAMAGAM